MNTIPFGETITYNDIAKIIAKRHGIKRMSAQAVGGAVGELFVFSLVVAGVSVLPGSVALSAPASTMNIDLRFLNISIRS